MTQQNAALVEQSAAAAQSLHEQASNLTRAVSQFKLGDAAAYSRTPQGAAHGVAAAPARSVANERKPLRLG